MKQMPLSRRAVLRRAGMVAVSAIVAGCAPQGLSETRSVSAPATGAPAPAAGAPATVAPATVTPAPTATPDPKAGWPTVFNMGYFGGDDPAAVMEGNEPLRALCEKKLGIPVKLFTGTSYTAVIEAMRNKKVDSMMVGPFSYVLAVKEAGAEAIAVGVSTSAKPPVYDPKLVPCYYSIIFTKKGSGINSLQDLKGHSFNFVDPASTSGHLMPKTYLLKNGINPHKDMRTVFAGSHATSVLSVWNGKAEAGATYMANFYNMADSGQVEICGFADEEINKYRTPEEVKQVFDACPKGKLAILGVTDPIPNTPFALRGDLPKSFKDAVKAILLSLKDDASYIAKKKGWFVDPTADLGLKHLDQFYDSLRDVAKLLDLDLAKMA